METSTGFKFYRDGILVDFADIFEPGNSGTTTGFKSGTTDLGILFKGGNSGYTTNYKNSIGQDLGSLFQRKEPFIASGTSTLVTNSSTHPNYCYAIFTGNGSITTKKTSGTLHIICVGGGGAGGTSKSGHSCGGGGGGGVHYVTQSLNMPLDTVLNVVVGNGGIAIFDFDQVRPGSESYVAFAPGFQYICRCTGGGGGNYTSAGAGGGYYNDPNDTSTIKLNGGNGGDKGNGINWSQVQNPQNPLQLINIPIPAALNGIPGITSAYSGGGAGGKGDSSGAIIGGGGGGNGIGGTRPATSPYSSYVGQNGLAYGGGGGGGGFYGISNINAGGNGANGIVIVYAEL
jgi:hypothetical protein